MTDVTVQNELNVLCQFMCELDCYCRSCFVELKSLLFGDWNASPYTLQVVQVYVAIGNSLLLLCTCYNFTPALMNVKYININSSVTQ